jgi:hypothetical protein
MVRATPILPPQGLTRLPWVAQNRWGMLASRQEAGHILGAHSCVLSRHSCRDLCNQQLTASKRKLSGIGQECLRHKPARLGYNLKDHMGSVLIKTPAIDPRYAQFRLSIRESRIHRRGVYAEEPIPARRKVIEYTGERISRRETKRRGAGPVTYLFTLDDYWTLDGAFGGSGAEIINHSCDPNLRSMNLKGHILYISKRAIRRGEELTVDYRFDKDIGKVRCRCGAKTCRGVINLLE